MQPHPQQLGLLQQQNANLQQQQQLQRGQPQLQPQQQPPQQQQQQQQQQPQGEEQEKSLNVPYVIPRCLKLLFLGRMFMFWQTLCLLLITKENRNAIVCSINTGPAFGWNPIAK
jgi:hypothetical protein